MAAANRQHREVSTFDLHGAIGSTVWHSCTILDVSLVAFLFDWSSTCPLC